MKVKVRASVPGTVVLNRNWVPVGVAPVARALIMLWNDVARVYPEYTRLGLCTVPPALVLAVAALWASVKVLGA